MALHSDQHNSHSLPLLLPTLAIPPHTRESRLSWTVPGAQRERHENNQTLKIHTIWSLTFTIFDKTLVKQYYLLLKQKFASDVTLRGKRR